MLMCYLKGLIAIRDDKLKAILTEDQMKKWTNEVEPAMRPQRKPAQK